MWSFLAHLRERKLAHWAIAYLAGAWLLLQVLGLLAQPFAWPDLVMKAATVLLAVGFLAVLVLAWYHGEKGAQKVSGVELLMLTALLVIAGAELAFVGGGRRGAATPTTSSDATAPAHARSAIAVLPFENLSAEGPHSYFAIGLHDELLTQLAKVAALSLRGRTTVMGYAGTTKSIREIGDELGVGAIVEGSVQVVGERLRVNVQLIDAATDEHLWAERYDRTLDDAFVVQSDVAQQIVAALGATLTRTETEAIAVAPTKNAEAYRLYLQGLEYSRRPGRMRRNVEAAQQLYERALVLDSTFALAHAALSGIHGQMSWYGYDPSRDRLARQREEAELALKLAPDLPQAHDAMGLVHYFGERDYRAALQEFRIALKGLPNEARIWAQVAFVTRRLGNWADVSTAVETAAQLDPRSGSVWEDLRGGTFLVTRRYADAVRAYDHALGLFPDLHLATVRKGMAYLLWTGERDSLRAALDRLLPDTDLGTLGSERSARAELLLLERKPDSLVALLQNARSKVFSSQLFLRPISLYEGWAHQLQEDEPRAQASFTSAGVVLDSLLTTFPDDWRVHAARGLTFVGLGRRRDALNEAGWLQRSVVYGDDAFHGPVLREARGMILAQAGEIDEALREVDLLLSGPAWISVHTLRLDPRWDPIRNDPRFRALLVKYANPQPVH